MSTIEEYAIDMVASGARSTIEDDLNEDEQIADADHEAACDLGLAIVRAIRANPDAILALARDGLAKVNDALREAGIEYPLGAAGVRDLAAMAAGRLEDLRTAEAERDEVRLKLVDVLEAWEAAVVERDDQRPVVEPWQVRARTSR